MIRLRNATILFLSLIIFISFEIKAQTPCSQKLDEAQDNFNQGHLYGIPGLLKDCIERGFTNEQRIQAYKLLTITYLYIDDPIGAENSYLELLKLDPEHKVDPAIDPIEIIYLNDKFTTTPYFTLQVLKLGINATNVSVINNYGTDNTQTTLEDYKTGFGATLGAGIDYNINKYFSVGLEAAFETRSYSWRNTVFGENEISLDQQYYKENLIGLSIPLFLRVTYPTRKWYPYAYGGYALKVNLSSRFPKTQFINRSLGSDGTTINSVTIETNNIRGNDFRNTLTTALVAGIGVKYRLEYEYISFDFRLNAGLKNYQNPDKRYQFESGDGHELNALYGIVMDDVRLNDLVFTIGYVKPLYKPRKKSSGRNKKRNQEE